MRGLSPGDSQELFLGYPLRMELKLQSSLNMERSRVMPPHSSHLPAEAIGWSWRGFYPNPFPQRSRVPNGAHFHRLPCQEREFCWMLSRFCGASVSLFLKMLPRRQVMGRGLWSAHSNVGQTGTRRTMASLQTDMRHQPQPLR